MDFIKAYIKINNTHNSKNIKRVIGSIIRQQERNFKLYICPEQESESVKKLINDYARQDKRVLICSENDLSVSFSDTGYICVLNVYNEYYPKFFTEMLNFMKSGNLDIALCGTESTEGSKKKTNEKNDIIFENTEPDVIFSEYPQFFNDENTAVFNTNAFREVLEKYSSDIFNFGAVLTEYILSHNTNGGIISKILCKHYASDCSFDDKVQHIIQTTDEISDILNREAPEKIINIYEMYTDSMMRILAEAVSAKLSKKQLLELTVQICKCRHTLSLMKQKNITDAQRSKSKDFLFRLADIIISLDDADTDHDSIELLCNTGEAICNMSDQTAKIADFQKLKVTMLIKNGYEKEAREKLDELSKLSENEQFVSDRKKILRLQNPSEIYDFSEYIDCLKYNLKKYTIFIVSLDTPWGPAFTPELTSEFMTLGLKENLYAKVRCGYIAVIDCGKVICEELSPRGKSAVWNGKIGNRNIRLESRGYEVVPFIDSEILIDGNNYVNKERGLNIVVYDKDKNMVIDDVSFDTFSDGLVPLCPYRLIYKLEQWHEKHPDIGLIRLIRPQFPKANLSADEADMVNNIAVWDKYNRISLKKYYNEDELRDIFTPVKAYFDSNGVRQFEDCKSSFKNIFGGHRFTVNQPDDFERTIYITGGCRILGTCTDTDTIPSIVQDLCNKNAKEQHFIVQNYGYGLAETDRKIMEELRILESFPLKKGDIVICDWGGNDFVSPNVLTLDLSKCGERPHDYGEIFIDAIPHFSPVGNRLIADKIFECLQENNFFSDLKTLSENDSITHPETSVVPSISASTDKSLEEYKNTLSELYQSKFSVGAIVMNCNPFTLGHRYLIDQAAKQCGHLVIFVVEEDKSVFKFEDRLDLVKLGTADIKNVTVIPSGQFILSSLTFSEYFNKSELQDRVIDTSKDVRIFGAEIAPCLHVTKRFVGNEPYDAVTRQYNNDMKAILPEYGIELVEIKRLESNDGTVISASEVRRLIGENNLTAIKELVPDTTFEFIKANFSDIQASLQ